MDKKAYGLLLLLLTTDVQAEGTMFIGVSHDVVRKPAEYLWWQPFYSTDMNLESQSVRLGYDYKVTSWLTARAAYDPRDRYSSTAQATKDEALMWTGVCDPHTTCSPPDLYQVSGRIQTIEAGLQLHLPYKYTPFIYGGYTVVRHDFKLKASAIGKNSAFGPIGHSETHQEHLVGVGTVAGFGWMFAECWVGAYVYTNPKADQFKKGAFPSGADTVKSYAFDCAVAF
jgi:hypothetical protein